MKPDSILKIAIGLGLIFTLSLAYGNTENDVHKMVEIKKIDNELGIYIEGAPAEKLFNSLTTPSQEVRGEGTYKIGKNIFCLKSQSLGLSTTKIFFCSMGLDLKGAVEAAY